MDFTTTLQTPTARPLRFHRSQLQPQPSRNNNKNNNSPSFSISTKKPRSARLVFKAAAASAATAGPSPWGRNGFILRLSPATRWACRAFQTVTLERPAPSSTAPRELPSPPPPRILQLATGGGDGDSGDQNILCGGDRGEDGSDDDDYFGDFDEGDDADEGVDCLEGSLSYMSKQLFGRKYVDAVLQEWCKTMMDSLAGLRQVYEMPKCGVWVSSAQMLCFLAIDTRLTVSRAISRTLPESLSRAFIGRMIADPSFSYQLIIERAATIGCSVWSELKNWKERIKQEWDLAFINILTGSACNAFVVWSLAPCRFYGSTFHFDLQNSIQKLPNTIFEKNYLLRRFDLQKRVHSFFYKAAELCLVGITAGAVLVALLKSLSAKEEGRILKAHTGEISRLAWFGAEADPLFQSDNLLTAYKRTLEAAADGPLSNWSINKNTIISGLGLLGKQGCLRPPLPRHKERVVLKQSLVQHNAFPWCYGSISFDEFSCGADMIQNDVKKF